MSLYLKNLSIRKPSGDELFPPVNISIDKGEVLTLMGPSGCGKSTLLSAVAGHLNDEFTMRGNIELENKSLNGLPAHQRRVGILFQDDLLFPHLTVQENLAFALPDDIRGANRKEKAREALIKIDLASIAESYPEQISGGQRARVSLIRMLLAEPDVALLDEPFSKLDKELRQTFRDWVFAQLKAADIPTLMVTHDIEDAPVNGQCLSWPW